MHSNELNKVFAAILSVMTFTVALWIFAEQIFYPKHPAEPAYVVETAEAPAAQAQQQAPQAIDIRAIMASADATRGQAAFRPCAACHTVERGGANRVGPNLWNTVAQRKAHIEGFNYSATMRQAAAAGQQWGYEELYRFLENPRGYMNGTSMSFAGIRRSQERADVIAYLRSLADNPAPLP